MCGIFGVSGHNDAAMLTYLGLYALQHRGEESSGIVSYEKNRIHQHIGMGTVCDVFNKDVIKQLKGKTALGHVRYSTTGSSDIKNVQPFVASHRKGFIAVAHNGNLTNSMILKDDMEKKGSIFQTSMDSEMIAHLFAASGQSDIKTSISWALSQLKGAYSLILLIDNLMIAARDPHGFRPLCLAKLGDAYIVSSETCALDLIEAEYIREIEPGEIVFIKKGKIESIKPFPPKKTSMCIFEFVYFSRPDSNIFGKNVYDTRKRLGQQIAKESTQKCDFVMPVPDSGNYAALGYAQESGFPFEIAMIRNHYVGRTFIQPSQGNRSFRVKVKLNPVKSFLKNKNITIIEDSIVRGTTTKVRIKTLREAETKEIHMKISCPPIKFPCFYGIDFPTKKELIAANQSVASIKKFLDLDSLEYLSLEGMLKCMPLEKNNFCTACFTGKYPASTPKKFSKYALEK